MTKDEIATRVRSTLARVLKTTAQNITDDASQMNLAGWDSVHHMNVVISVENDFGIEFDDDELPMLTSLPLLVAAVEKHTSV